MKAKNKSLVVFEKQKNITKIKVKIPRVKSFGSLVLLI